jgi:hypothetical protein
VRIRNADGVILGAGMVLGTGHILTCAHVVEDPSLRTDSAPEVSVVVDFLSRSDLPSTRARVAPGSWVPPLDDERGDVALLELERAVPDDYSAPLRRLPLWNRVVHTFGYPKSLEKGVWVTTKLAGRGGPGGEWVQMNQTSQGVGVRRGFSGSGVVDEDTGHVVGMVVGEYTEEAAGLSWMIPVDTIVRHLPGVADRVSGGAAVDHQFVEQFAARPADGAIAQLIASFFAGRTPERVLVIVTGDSGSSASATLSRAVVLSSPELRPRSDDRRVGQDPNDTVPPVGSIGLAITATGKTAEEVSRRIVDWMGIPVDESTELSDHLTDDVTPMAIVVDRVDEAADPDAMVNEVLIPLTKRAAERDIRLLAGFRREPPPSMDALIQVSFIAIPSAVLEDTASVARGIESLADRIEEVAAAERAARQRHREVAPRIAHGPDAPARSSMLRLRLTHIRAVAGAGHPVLPAVDACARAAERALRKARETMLALDESLARRNELRGLLDAYEAMAASAGLTEDIDLAARYRQAREQLWRGRCDLPIAAESVHRYVRAVREKLGDGSGKADS